MDLLFEAVGDTVYLLWKVLPAMFIGLFAKRVLLLLVVTFIVQLLVHAGVLSALELLIAPLHLYPWMEAWVARDVYYDHAFPGSPRDRVGRCLGVLFMRRLGNQDREADCNLA